MGMPIRGAFGCRRRTDILGFPHYAAFTEQSGGGGGGGGVHGGGGAVSYTHLTLPTICSV
eukprot:3933000-Rhodomonas_salina.1